ncbi:zinc finger protein-like 1 isoform X1 [Petromyzon marinus]|uniref:zinc finger protein-like 1 isoform X1 n=1 Tax=Petromyzon marinus TaxID=7757 RepID=UPI003F6EBA84
MGLCKCPKRRVTNLFCFEHRVNVCEHCLAASHGKCIVQSYLQWLQDSDYSPDCPLCSTALAGGDTVRLMCYDVFHWACLNTMAAQLPPNTAPAGYCCPSCKAPIFPSPNLAGPVATALRAQLSSVNWARAGLGLSVIEEPEATSKEAQLDVTDYQDWPPASSSFHATDGTRAMQEQRGEPEDGAGGRAVTVGARGVGDGGPLSGTGGDPAPAIAYSPGDEHTASPVASAQRKVYDATAREPFQSTSIHVDTDEDKYRRRPALQWLARWFRSRSAPQSRRKDASLVAGARRQRRVVLLVLGLLAFLTLLLVMSQLGRGAADSDPLLDPLANPHIRVQQPRLW